MYPNAGVNRYGFLGSGRSALLAAPIHIFSMTNLDHYHDYFVVIDLVNDPIVFLPHAVSFLT